MLRKIQRRTLSNVRYGISKKSTRFWTETRSYRCIVESTPNPNARKITPVTQKGIISAVVPPDSRWSGFQFARFRRGDLPDKYNENTAIPLVSDIFRVTDNVVEVLLNCDFITVCVTSDEFWTSNDDTSAQIFHSVDTFFEADQIDTEKISVWLKRGDHESSNFEKNPKFQQLSREQQLLVLEIEEILETKVRPQLQVDGGDVVLRNFENRTVYLSMVGACASCPSSTVTMRFMIQNLLRFEIFIYNLRAATFLMQMQLSDEYVSVATENAMDANNTFSSFH